MAATPTKKKVTMIRDYRTLLTALACLTAAGTCGSAGAVTVGGTVDFLDQGTLTSPAPDEFAIVNVSDPGIRIVSVTIDLTLADTNYEDYDDQQPHYPRWDTAPGCSPQYCYGVDIDGQPIAARGPSAGIVGFVAPTEAEQAMWEEAVAITLFFTDFDAGEVFSFTGDVDDTVNYRIAGREFAYTTLSITFAGDALPGGTLTLTDQFWGDPDNKWRAAGRVQNGLSPVPVPAAAWLFVSALGLLGARRRRG
jgi:hypothetical protein